MTENTRGNELGSFIANIRLSRRLSLREVEEASGREVSNAYLSQLERGKINKPSPNILFKIAEVYSVSYERLMEKAGYLTSRSERSDSEKHGRVATFSNENLTSEEEEELLKYLAFLRTKNR